MKKLSIIALLLMLSGMFAGCTFFSEAPPAPIPCEMRTSAPIRQWYNSGHTLLLRHEGVLQFGSMTIPMTGVMKLDTQSNEATVAILTSMGIKILAMKMTSNSHEVVFSSPAAEKIPGFLEGAPAAIRAVFLAPFPHAGMPCFGIDNQREYVDKNPDGLTRFRVDVQTDELISKDAELDDASWLVTYGQGVEVEGLRLPGEIEFEDRDNGFTVILKLISAKQQ